MKLKEAKEILNSNGYLLEEFKKTWRTWFDEYEMSHDCGYREIDSMIEDLATECDEEWRRHFSEPEYAIDISYEDLVEKWGKPEDN